MVAEVAYKGNMKRRMERANKINAGAAVILGDAELAEGMAVVKNLDRREPGAVALPDLLRRLPRPAWSRLPPRPCRKRPTRGSSVPG